MWFAYEAIRFILDGERDQDRDQDQDQDAETETEVDEKLALMHSLDLEQLKADKLVDRDIILQVEQQQQQHDELTARIAATVAAVAAAAAAANARDRERDVDTAGDMDTTRELELEEAAVGGGLIESSSAAVVSGAIAVAFSLANPCVYLHLFCICLSAFSFFFFFCLSYFFGALHVSACECQWFDLFCGTRHSTRAAAVAAFARRRCLAVRQSQRRNRWRTVGQSLDFSDSLLRLGTFCDMSVNMSNEHSYFKSMCITAVGHKSYT